MTDVTLVLILYFQFILFRVSIDDHFNELNGRQENEVERTDGHSWGSEEVSGGEADGQGGWMGGGP